MLLPSPPVAKAVKKSPPTESGQKEESLCEVRGDGETSSLVLPNMEIALSETVVKKWLDENSSLHILNMSRYPVKVSVQTSFSLLSLLFEEHVPAGKQVTSLSKIIVLSEIAALSKITTLSKLKQLHHCQRLTLLHLSLIHI